jgi:hypothetical protein
MVFDSKQSHGEYKVGLPLSAVSCMPVLFFAAAALCSDCCCGQDRDGLPPIYEIELTQGAAKDERLKLLAPPSGSLDKLEFTADGLWLKQVEAGGSNAKSSGFTLDARAQRSFVFALNYEIKQLEAPKATRIQGLWIRFVLEGNSVPAVGIVAGPRVKRGLATTANHTDSTKLDVQLEPIAFGQGTLAFERQGRELLVYVAETPESFRVVKRVPFPDQPLIEIQVVGSRFSSGNAPAEYLFKSLQFGDSERALKPPERAPWITLALVRQLVYYGCMLGACAFLGRYYYLKLRAA